MSAFVARSEMNLLDAHENSPENWMIFISKLKPQFAKNQNRFRSSWIQVAKEFLPFECIKNQFQCKVQIARLTQTFVESLSGHECNRVNKSVGFSARNKHTAVMIILFRFEHWIDFYWNSIESSLSALPSNDRDTPVTFLFALALTIWWIYALGMPNMHIHAFQVMSYFLFALAKCSLPSVVCPWKKNGQI